MSFGRNDIEMLEAVGTGVAMGNAIDEVKARADVICKSVEEDGVYHYCLEKKLIQCWWTYYTAGLQSVIYSATMLVIYSLNFTTTSHGKSIHRGN